MLLSPHYLDPKTFGVMLPYLFPSTMHTARKQGSCRRIDLSLPRGPQEGQRYVAILIYPEKASIVSAY